MVSKRETGFEDGEADGFDDGGIVFASIERIRPRTNRIPGGGLKKLDKSGIHLLRETAEELAAKDFVLSQMAKEIPRIEANGPQGEVGTEEWWRAYKALKAEVASGKTGLQSSFNTMKSWQQRGIRESQGEDAARIRLLLGMKEATSARPRRSL